MTTNDPISPDHATKEHIERLAHGQPYGVLCTQANSVPYGSMVAFAFTDDLSAFVFATATDTRKYRLLSKCRNVALVVSNQSDFPRDLMKIEAFTVTGVASETEPQGLHAEAARLLITKHPQLKPFVESASTRVFMVRNLRFLLVTSFQQVHEWEPPPVQ